MLVVVVLVPVLVQFNLIKIQSYRVISNCAGSQNSEPAILSVGKNFVYFIGSANIIIGIHFHL